MSIQGWGILATSATGLIVAYLTYRAAVTNKQKDLEIKRLEVNQLTDEQSRAEFFQVRDQLLADLRARIETKNEVIAEKEKRITEQDKIIEEQRQQIIDLQNIVSEEKNRPARRIPK